MKFAFQRYQHKKQVALFPSDGIRIMSVKPKAIDSNFFRRARLVAFSDMLSSVYNHPRNKNQNARIADGKAVFLA